MVFGQLGAPNSTTEGFKGGLQFLPFLLIECIVNERNEMTATILFQLNL